MGYTSLTDKEIIGHLVQNPYPRLLEELVRRHQSSVLRQCRRKLKDTEAAHDVSQEVWIQVHTRLGQYKAEGTFAAWLSVIVHHRCIDHLQNNKRWLHQEISQQMVDGLEEGEAMDTEDLRVPTVEIWRN